MLTGTRLMTLAESKSFRVREAGVNAISSQVWRR